MLRLINFRKTTFLSLAVLCTVIALLGLVVQAQEEHVLIMGHAEITDSLDPAHGFTQTTSMVNRATYDTLVTFPDEDASSIEPRLATAWEVSEDGLVYTFTLLDGVVFSNGEPLTADDVAFSFTRLMHANGNPSFLADHIESVEAIDDQTVAITIDGVDPSFLSALANTVFSVTNADVVRENGGTDAEDAAETDTAEEYLNNNSAGTGPYMLESWVPQDETVLVRNPNYRGEPPYFDRILIVNIPEGATQKVALDSGDIDLATDLTADQVIDFDDNPDIIVYRRPSNYIHFILMNQDPERGGPVSDPTVQLAVRYALDYEGYRTLWPGAITPGSNLLVGLASAYDQDQAFERDLDRSRELLAEAGYPDGFEITLSYPDLTWAGVNANTNAQKIQADLAEVGIVVDLNPGEVQVSLDEYRRGEQGFAYWFWGPDILDPVDLMSFLPGGKVGAERANWSDDIADPELLELRDQARVELDPEVRLELYAQLQDYLQQSGPWAPFVQPAMQVAYGADIQGFVWHLQWQIDVTLMSRAE